MSGALSLSDHPCPMAFRFDGFARAQQSDHLHREEKRAVLDRADTRLYSLIPDSIKRRCFRWKIGDGSQCPRRMARDLEIAFRILLCVENDSEATRHGICDRFPAIVIGEFILLSQLGGALRDGA